MLENLEISGFKCFDQISISLNRINVFSGTNSSGKSSAIQAFLLLCNNAVKNASSPLNGMWLRLGAFDECRNHRVNARSFDIAAVSGNEKFKVKFSAGESENDGAEITFISESALIQSLIGLENKHVYYLPANRIGPEDSYPKNFDRVNFLGNRAEYIIDYLFKNRKLAVESALIADSASITLEHQVNYWLAKLFGIKNSIRDLGLSNSLSVEYSLGDGKPVRPYHMGSGVSFALGVLVACLSARPEDIVIIENPEIHLHPKAQSDLTEFLCFAANAGIQIILETHSDHVFNGLRKSVVKGHIPCTNIATHFFQLDSNAIAQSIQITINEHGRLEKQPKGLFDQFDDDLDQILGL